MNKAILMGRLTRDPEVRMSQNNLAITNFTLAVDRRFVRQGEERQADFIPIVTFGKTAEFCDKYFRKGQRVLVSGRIQTRSYDDREGVKRYVTEIVGEEVHFADGKNQTDGGSGARQGDYGYYPELTPGAPQSPYGVMRSSFEDPGAPNYAGSSAAAVKNERDVGADFDGQSTKPLSKENEDDGFMPIENESDLPF